MSVEPAEIARVPRSKQAARAAYDRISSWYDLLAASSEAKLIDLGVAALRIRPGETILEIGFGTGYALIELARAAGPSGRVYGLDLSEGMARVAARKLLSSDLAKRPDLVIADGARIPFRAGAFDTAFCSFTLELFDTPEIPVVLAEIDRILASDGRLGIVSLSKENGQRWPVRLYEWAHRKLPTLLDCRPIFLERALLQAGYAVSTRTTRSLWGLPVEVLTAHKQQIDPGQGGEP